MVFSKNWYPVANSRELYQSNLTGEYIRKNIVKVSFPYQI